MRVHVFVSGQVQGVLFRASTRRKAFELGLGGWVKNLSDGRVEAVFEGPDEQVREMLLWCRKGPPASTVKKVETKTEESEGLGDFKIKY